MRGLRVSPQRLCQVLNGLRYIGNRRSDLLSENIKSTPTRTRDSPGSLINTILLYCTTTYMRHNGQIQDSFWRQFSMSLFFKCHVNSSTRGLFKIQFAW